MPQPDNEKILALVQESEEYMRSLTKRLIDAHITPFALNAVIQAWQCVSSCYATSESQNRPVGMYGVGAAMPSLRDATRTAVNYAGGASGRSGHFHHEIDIEIAEKLPDATPEMRETESFKAVWECIREWDINVLPGTGFMGATGSHVRAILDALQKTANVEPAPQQMPSDLHQSASYKDLDAAIEFLESCQPTFSDGFYWAIAHPIILEDLIQKDNNFEFISVESDGIYKYKKIKLKMLDADWLIDDNEYLGYVFSPCSLKEPYRLEDIDINGVKLARGSLNFSRAYRLQSIGGG